MALGSGDFLLYESEDAGSVGGAISATTITSGVSNNLWADITSSERIAGGVRYRKVFWKNNSATDSAVAPVLYAPVLPTNITLSLGLGFDDSADDDSAQGNMSAFGATALVALESDGTDTRTVTLYGLDSGGNPQTEDVVLTSATEKLSANTYSAVHGAVMSATDGSRTVTLSQGSGGTNRGSIGPGKAACWLWVVSPSAKAGGIALPDLPAGSNYGVWLRQSWSAGVASVRPDTMTLTIEENN